MKIWHRIANPRIRWDRIPISEKIVEACRTVDSKKRDLQDQRQANKMSFVNNIDLQESQMD